MIRGATIRWAVAAACIVIVGCGPDSAERPVCGRVNYRGKPIPNGSVQFFPPSGRPVGAALAPDGTYQAQLQPGRYTIVITPGWVVPENFRDGDPLPPNQPVVPKKYQYRDQSDLFVEVPPGKGMHEVPPFDLGD